MSTTISTARATDLPPPPGGLSIAPSDARDRATIAAADHASRHWISIEPGRLRPGSAAHKLAVTQMFRDTFNPYKPTIIDWPKLSDEERDRLVSLPIWDIAVQTEGKARLRMLSYANSLTDPDWRDAIGLNGWEEGRHKDRSCPTWSPRTASARAGTGVPSSRATRNGPIWSPASASASIASSPSACSRWPSGPASSRPNWSTRSSR